MQENEPEKSSPNDDESAMATGNVRAKIEDGKDTYEAAIASVEISDYNERTSHGSQLSHAHSLLAPPSPSQRKRAIRPLPDPRLLVP